MRLAITILLTLLLISCTPKPSTEKKVEKEEMSDICAIFQQHPEWYTAAKQAQDKWGIPVATQMAIINKESKFKIAKPQPQQAAAPFYGYSPAHAAAWQQYKNEIRETTPRNEFDTTTDFLGWFSKKAQELGIQQSDTYTLYLVYQQGFDSYKSGNYRMKSAMDKARQVANQAQIYQQQLPNCEVSLKLRSDTKL